MYVYLLHIINIHRTHTLCKQKLISHCNIRSNCWCWSVLIGIPAVSCLRKPTNQPKQKERKKKTQCRQNELHLEPYPFLPWQNLLHFNFLWSIFRHIWWRASKAQHYRRKNGAFQGVYGFQRSLSHRLCGLIGSFPSRVTWKIHSIWSNSRYYVRAMLRLQGICFVAESS